MNQSKLTVCAAVAVLAAFVGCSTRARADAHIDVASVKVPYRDLDLSRDSDVQRLYARLQKASTDVCRPVAPDDLQFDAYRNCANAALDRAVLQVKSPRLQMLHAANRVRHRWG